MCSGSAGDRRSRNSSCSEALAGPPARHDLAVVLLSDWSAERDQRDPVRARFEVSHHAGADAQDVPLPQVTHLVVELDPARALGDHVDLLLPRMRVPEGRAYAGRQLLDAD